jgi:hypothetical protein
MYTVSEAYKSAMKHSVQKFRMKGSVGKVAFTDDNILAGSFSITNQCSDSTSVQIGQVYIGELSVTLTNMNIARYGWKDQTITPIFGMMVSDGIYEDVPLGVFTIDSAKHTASGIVIKAYDNMAKFDKTCSVTSINGSAYNLMAAACTACGLILGSTEDEMAQMANGIGELSLYSENDIETWRDFVSWIAMTVGANAYAGRDGKIYLRAYDQNIVDEIDETHRFEGCEFSDFSTRYTGLSVVNIKEKTTNYCGLEVDDALTYNVGSNPFMQYGVDERKENMRKALLDALAKIDYVPFKAEMVGNPAYDLMDVFHFTGGLADGKKLFCMTKFTFHYNQNFIMEGVGQDPALASAKSKTDKNLQGILASTENQEYVRYYDYMNADAYDIGDQITAEIINIHYITVKQTHIDFHAEIKLELTSTEKIENDRYTDSDITVTVTYYLNGFKIRDYIPVETMPDGTHLLHLLFTWDSTANMTGSFEVYLSLSGGSAHIDRGAARAYLSGQGLAGEGSWDGTISVYDTIPETNMFNLLQLESDKVLINLNDSESINFAENVPEIQLSSFLGSFTETVNKVEFLHQFDTNHLTDVTYNTSQIEVKKRQWKLKSSVTKAELLTKDCEVDQVIKVNVVCDSDVNFLVSFDHGSTWWEYTEGWDLPDTTKDSYGVSDSKLKEITALQWSEKLNGYVMIKAILNGSSTLSNIQIYTREVKE